MRFSLLALIGFVALAAIGCAALVNANDLWLVGISTTTFMLVLLAIILAVAGQGPTRGFAIGFAIASLAYLLLIYFGIANENAGAGYLATTRALKRLHDVVATHAPAPATGRTGTYSLQQGTYSLQLQPMYSPPTQAPNAATNQPVVSYYTLSGGSATVGPYSPDRDQFMQIGQQLWALLIGCLGGVFASYLWWRRAT